MNRAGWLLLFPVVACTSVTVDPQGRPCSPTMPCGPGTVCDPVTSTCVKPAADGLQIADAAGPKEGGEDTHVVQDQGVPPDQGVPDQTPPPDQGAPDQTPPPDQGVPDQAPPPDQGVPDQAPPPDQALPPDQGVPDQAPPPDQGVPDTATGQDGGTPQVVSKGPSLHLSIPDGSYKGTLQSMQCVSLDVVDIGLTSIQQVQVTVGITHSYLGDLIIKVQDPGGLVTTVLSRPGINEPVDNYYPTNGDSSNLSASHPITFRDNSSNDAEQMGDTIGPSASACKDDGTCDYAPNPGAGPGTSLADFKGRDPVGTWQVCVGDGYGGDDGWVESVTLAVTSI